ncbi:MAG: hemerythrin family protein [Noviherbaspirillum sp.]
MSAAFSQRRYWSPRMSLGMPAVDATHRELLDELASLEQASDAEFGASYARFVAKVERDFREEEELMEQMSFSGLANHREQHARMLGGLHHVAIQVMAGDIAAGREVAALMPGWFMLHIETMDGALALSALSAQEQG